MGQEEEGPSEHLLNEQTHAENCYVTCHNRSGVQEAGLLYFSGTSVSLGTSKLSQHEMSATRQALEAQQTCAVKRCR